MPDMNVKVSTLVWTCLALAGLGACVGKLDRPQRFAAAVTKYNSGGSADASIGERSPTAKGADAVAPPACALQLFKGTCGVAGCHAKGSAYLDLASSGVETRLIDKKSSDPVCGSHTYVATDGTSSLLLDKLTDSPPCGAKMPLGGMISKTDRQCLADWVSSLASESDAGAAL
jgi:hypothetical protein